MKIDITGVPRTSAHAAAWPAAEARSVTPSAWAAPFGSSHGTAVPVTEAPVSGTTVLACGKPDAGVKVRVVGGGMYALVAVDVDVPEAFGRCRPVLSLVGTSLVDTAFQTTAFQTTAFQTTAFQTTAFQTTALRMAAPGDSYLSGATKVRTTDVPGSPPRGAPV